MMIVCGFFDYVGVFGKYLFEVELGLLVCVVVFLVLGIFNKQLNFVNVLVIVILQLGCSLDILCQVKDVKVGGVYIVVVVNDEILLLVELCDEVLFV